MTGITRPNGPAVDPQDIVSAMHTFGYTRVTAEDVQEFARTGALPESTVGPEYDEHATDALQTVFDELGIEVGAAVAHASTCEVVKQRAALDRELALDPKNEALLGARIEYYGGGDQEVEVCDCGAIQS